MEKCKEAVQKAEEETKVAQQRADSQADYADKVCNIPLPVLPNAYHDNPPVVTHTVQRIGCQVPGREEAGIEGPGTSR